MGLIAHPLHSFTCTIASPPPCCWFVSRDMVPSADTPCSTPRHSCRCRPNTPPTANPNTAQPVGQVSRPAQPPALPSGAGLQACPATRPRRPPTQRRSRRLNLPHGPVLKGRHHPTNQTSSRANDRLRRSFGGLGRAKDRPLVAGPLPTPLTAHGSRFTANASQNPSRSFQKNYPFHINNLENPNPAKRQPPAYPMNGYLANT